MATLSWVRKSKFRHNFGKTWKYEECYEDIKATGQAWDTDLMSVNQKFLAVDWDCMGGGAVAVIPLSHTGRMPVDMPMVKGHTRPVLDLSFSPFNPNILATSSDDGTVKLWDIPEGGLTQDLMTPVADLECGRKVGGVVFHPCASNVIAAVCAGDNIVKVYDVEKHHDPISMAGHQDQIQSLSWNMDGSLYTTQCRDRHVRVVDPRANSVVMTTNSHPGPKPARVTWFQRKNLICSCGFGKSSTRQFLIWDPRNFTEPIAQTSIDQAAGVMMPFFDEDTSILYIAAKGESNIRYYEITGEPPFCHYLSYFGEGQASRGMAMFPKKYLKHMECEVTRLYKLTQTTVDPITFTVPRRSDCFQDDLFPPTFEDAPCLTSEQWFAGQTAVRREVPVTPNGTNEASPVAVAVASPLPSSPSSMSPPPARLAHGSSAITQVSPASPVSPVSPCSSPASPIFSAPAVAPVCDNELKEKVDKLEHELVEKNREVEELTKQLAASQLENQHLKEGSCSADPAPAPEATTPVEASTA